MLLAWFESEEIALDQASVQDCVRYRNELGSLVKKDGKPLTAGTIRNRLKAGKSLFKRLASAGKIPADPFREVPYPRTSEHISRNVLTEAQMGRLLGYLLDFDAPPSAARRLARYRLHVIGEFLYATGLRISEAAALIPENVDAAARTVYVTAGKGGTARFAFMTGFAADVMSRYLSRGRKAVLGRRNGAYAAAVFGTHPGRLTAWVNKELMKTCRRLELPVITSHGFRHSLGTHLLRAGCDMRYIQIILGHECLQTTQSYTRVDKEALRDSLDAYHPRRRR
jgi:site-specific recombinase XerD